MHLAQKNAVGCSGTMDAWCGKSCHSPCRSRGSSGVRMRRRNKSVLRRAPCRSSTSYACCCTMSTPMTRYSVTTNLGPGTCERTSLRTRAPTSIKSWLRSPRAPPRSPVVLGLVSTWSLSQLSPPRAEKQRHAPGRCRTHSRYMELPVAA